METLDGDDETAFANIKLLFSQGAALIAAQCKSGLLRTPQTIQQFKSVQAPPGQFWPQPGSRMSRSRMSRTVAEMAGV